MAVATGAIAADGPYGPMPSFANAAPPAPYAQTPEEAKAKSQGCFSCHKETDSANMHASSSANIGCVDCHGGDATIAFGTYTEEVAKKRAHVQPRFPLQWKYPSSANPEQSYALLNRESPEFIRFINPGEIGRAHV